MAATMEGAAGILVTATFLAMAPFVAPLNVSDGERCVYGGYAGGYRGAGRYRGNGYIPGYGAVCSFPYVSVGERCVRAR
jgi:hypothetical protein